MTIKDIARESGYAVGTVSRVLNNHPDVSEEARERVLAVVEKHNFHPNSNAKRLKQQASNSVSVIVKGARNLLFAELVEIIQALVKEKGYLVTVSYIDEDDNELEEAKAVCAERKPLGILFLGSNLDAFQADFGSIRAPCVLVTNRADTLDYPNLSSVSTDDVSGAAQAMDYLIRRGHRNIGVIGGRGGCWNTSQSRFTGCQHAIAQHRIPFDMARQFVEVRFSMSAGYQAMEELLARDPDMTALFAMSDVMAVGAIRAIQDRGLRVPEDISVMGFDGIELGSYYTPKLATIKQDGERLARRGVEILLQCVEHGGGAIHEIVPFRLIEGESVRALV